MSAIGSVSSHAAALHQVAGPKASPVKINDGDADDIPKAAALVKLATSGPGQRISKVA